jgi:tRNA-Thr(GGU) m(6)t(6)A37 methyltransferase TsaA
VSDDAELLVRAVGYVRSPLTDAATAPRQGDEGAPPASIEFDASVGPALAGLHAGDEVLVLTWLDRADRAVLVTHPRDDPDRAAVGVFATRSPHRPNPLGLHRVRLRAVDGLRLDVEGLEALDGTPVLDLKPVLGPVSER